MLDRFDYTQDQRSLLNKAVEIGFVDAVELGCMMANHGTNVHALFDGLTEAAFSNIHSERRLHTEWVQAFDAYYKVINRKRAGREAA